MDQRVPPAWQAEVRWQKARGLILSVSLSSPSVKGDSGNKTAIIYRGLAWVFFPSSSLYRHHAQLIPVHFARPAQFSVTFYHGTTPGRCWLRPRHTGWRQAVLTQEHVARCSPHSLVGAQKTAVTCLSIFSSSLPLLLNLYSVKHPNCAGEISKSTVDVQDLQIAPRRLLSSLTPCSLMLFSHSKERFLIWR